jgi:hypothetical protein
MIGSERGISSTYTTVGVKCSFQCQFCGKLDVKGSRRGRDTCDATRSVRKPSFVNVTESSLGAGETLVSTTTVKSYAALKNRSKPRTGTMTS